MNKGAMFGLDARIALAIFAVLTLIAGVSVFNIKVKTTAQQMLSLMRELETGVEQYMLDTGLDLPEVGGFANRRVDVLLTNVENVRGWNGPYVTSFDQLQDSRSLLIVGGTAHVTGAWRVSCHRVDDVGTSGADRRFPADNARPCRYWINVDRMDTSTAHFPSLMYKDIYIQIEKMVDGEFDDLRSWWHDGFRWNAGRFWLRSKLKPFNNT